METGAEEYEAKAMTDIKKRGFINSIRPPHYWNFFEDGKEEDRVQHVMRYDANPFKCYNDGRVEVIMQNISEIANNLKNYEDVKWKMMLKMSWEIFNIDFKKS